MTDAIDRAIRTGMHELDRLRDPLLCTCYSTTDTDLVLHPVLCNRHSTELRQIVGYRTFKYQRWFNLEQDAKDRASIIRDRWPVEGYGTSVQIHHISRFWLLTAWWANSAE